MLYRQIEVFRSASEMYVTKNFIKEKYFMKSNIHMESLE